MLNCSSQALEFNRCNSAYCFLEKYAPSTRSQMKNNRIQKKKKLKLKLKLKFKTNLSSHQIINFY